MAKPSGDTEAWRVRIEAFRASGLSGQAFAEREGVHESTLYRWARVLRTKTPTPSTAIVRSPSGASMIPLEIHVAGVVLKVYPGFDPDLLQEVIQLLEDDA